MKEAVEQYISKALGQTLLLTPMPVGTALPMFYTSQYDFCSGVLSGVECVFCFEKEGKRTTPLNIRKRLAFLTGQFQREVVYCADALEFHATQQMMTYGIPFIVPGKALFLPFLAVALKSTMHRRLMDRERFSTYAQLVVLGVLLHKLPPAPSIREVERTFGCSHPSAVYALKELEQFGLGKKQARQGAGDLEFRFSQSGRALWEACQDYLVNPCKRTVGVMDMPGGVKAFKAGANALAERTMLAEVPPEMCAVGMTEFRKGNYEAIPADEADIVLQLWRYRPDILGDGAIDPLSLALSLRGESDERVQMALDEMMEDFQW